MPVRLAVPTEEAYRFPLTIRHLLDAAMASAAHQEIIYRNEVRLTYAQLKDRIGQLASALHGQGVEEGATVAVMDWDSHRYLEAYFTVPMMGAVLQTVNVRLPIPQIVYTLQDAQAEVLIVHADFFPIIDSILPSLPHVRAVIAILDGTGAALPPWASGEFEALLAGASADFPFRDFDENAVATTFYTTGTTGNPKGVCFTHRQLVLHSLAAMAPFGSVAGCGLGYRDVYMPLTPMFHVHAWGMPYIATMLGVKQVYPGRYDPAMICALQKEHKVSYSHCVPTILQMVLKAADESGADLTGWRMTIGGAALTKALCEQGRQRGMHIIAGYGLSETAPLISVGRVRPQDMGDDAAEIESLTGTVPGPLVSARIVDEAMNDLPHDGRTRGELVLRAPWLTPCYTGDEAASRALWRGGWMHTQDIATIDADGVIRIRDRLKDVIKTGGEWIDSLALEDLLITAEGVAEIAVIAVPDPQWGERPMAVVVAEADASISLSLLNARLIDAIESGQITRYAKLDRFEVVESLPRTSVGKIDKKSLRAQFGDAQPAGAPLP